LKMETNTKLTIVVSLCINHGCEVEFEHFESAAAQIMRKHGGAIERRIRFATQPEHRQPGDGQPDEVHVVTFHDAASFERYRADPDLKPLAALRSRAISFTRVWLGTDLSSF
jgi:uncharacterized protein (DUF1330 family)